MSAPIAQVEETPDGLSVTGIAIPFGGRDLDGERFTAATDLALSWFPSEGRPMLFDHAKDALIGTEVVGRQIERRVTEAGIWIKAQLDRRARWFALVQELLARGALGFSSGAMGHLVQKSKGGDILRWPWVEVSLTATPASTQTPVIYAVKSATAIEHLTAVEAMVAVAHVKAAGNVLPADELHAIAARVGSIEAARQAELRAIVRRAESASVDQGELQAIARNASRRG
ncbi:MAG: hypothetical protein ABIZ57_03320, partial [Candidatus Limnocylindria bacterium]